MFLLGVIVGRAGLTDPGRRVLVFGRGLVGLGVVAVVVLVFAYRNDLRPLAGGLSVPALGVAVIEGSLTVCATVVLLAVACAGSLGPRWRILGRAAFAAYVLQAPAIVGIALVLRPVQAPPMLKFLLLTAGALMVAFGLPTVFGSRSSQRSRPAPSREDHLTLGAIITADNDE